MQFKKAIPT